MMQMTLKCLRVLYLLNHIPCWSLLSLCKTKNKKQKNHFLIRNVLLWAGRSTMGTVSQACGSQSEAWGMKRQQSRCPGAEVWSWRGAVWSITRFPAESPSPGLLMEVLATCASLDCIHWPKVGRLSSIIFVL